MDNYIDKAKCTHCNSENTYLCDTIDGVFDINNKGYTTTHHRCISCNKFFRIKTNFDYKITSQFGV